MSAGLDRRRSEGATREGGVDPLRPPLICSCRHCDRSFLTIDPRDRRIDCNHSQLKVVR